MFTGIIEALGIVESIEQSGSNTTIWIASPISSQLKVDQSIAHSGVCLTVEEVADSKHKVTAIEETMKKTNLETWQTCAQGECPKRCVNGKENICRERRKEQAKNGKEQGS